MIVFRASGIGHPCPRHIWFKAVQGLEEPISPKTRRIFDTGTLLEPLIVRTLQEDGWDCEYNQGSQEAECLVTIPVCPGVEIQGHHDVVATQDGQRVMLDIKTMNDKSYMWWRKKGTYATHLNYATQVSIYAHAHGIPLAGIAGWNKNNCEYHVEVFPTDGALVQEAIEKAAFISQCLEPPEPGDLPGWCCNYCGFFGRECNG